MASRDVFRLLDLPGELREIIYYHSAEDLPAIDTAAIKNHGISKVPLIAQLCRDVREECLAVLYRNRELRFSFHCERNIERGNMWLHAAGHHSEMPCTIVFAGVLKQTSEFFHVTIRCSKDQPQFHVATRPGASKKTELLCVQLAELVEKYLADKAVSRTEQSIGKLYGHEVKDIQNLVYKKSRWDRPPKPRRWGIDDEDYY